MPIKLCKDCKHYNLYADKHFAFNFGPYFGGYCMHPKNLLLSVEDGKWHPKNSIAEVRVKGKCGKSGKWFENG
jgi:hypothetical protein